MMLRDLSDDIAGRKLYIYGAGVRARQLAECLTAMYHVNACGFMVTNKGGNISLYTTSKGVEIPVMEFAELTAATNDASGIYIINTVNNAVIFGIIDAVNDFMREHGGAECLDLTDGEHEDLQFALLRDYMSTLGADIDADVLDFNGFKLSNPAKLNKYSFETLFPSIGDVILPGVYGDHRLAVLGPYEFGNVTLVPGETVIDAGANVGAFACLAAHKGCRVIAFDPSSDVLPLLLKQSDLYGGMITVVPKGLSDSTETAAFHATPKLQGSSLTRVYEGAHTVTIETVTLDEYVRTSGIDNIGFIKCDVVGAEKLFLAGARETIKKFRPKISLHVYGDEWQLLSDIITSIEPQYKLERNQCKLYAWIG